MSLSRVKNIDDHVERTRRAIFADAGLLDCLELEMEGSVRSSAVLDPLQKGFRALEDAGKDRSDTFRRTDLPLMDLVGTYAEEIPFHTLLEQINETRRRGLDVGGDDA
ncbi:hypothetical protein [Thiocapsa marina]|uniref:Uncharacterized protein n=1 Tax=Thiocapsa marina 5811 TaxID=768671 RepID=F9UBI0_9GAMM|nr:hypothetical protein [Thiocapsa marina]EGV18298.1 hypothetical protein ThimaDRAFT_2282 [Thiocapsa marina 5811]